MITQIDQIAAQIAAERNAAWAEVERLKAELSNLQPKTSRPEPSRLEIAAMFMSGTYANSNITIESDKILTWSLNKADKLIAMAQEDEL